MAGDYLVEKRLGHGGMGDVFLLRSNSGGEQLAAKRILPALLHREQNRRAFLHELRTWIDLPGHPNITACRFFRTVDNQTVVLAEYVEGGSLEEWLRAGKLTTLERALDVAIQIGWGLEVAHRQGLVHQDVKPLNVLMTPEGTPKVTDFGLAKVRALIEAARAGGVDAGDTPARVTLVTGAAGTPAYRSPEQAAGERLSEQTDIWSWGLSLLTMLCGERTWRSGVAADRVLQGRLKIAKDDSSAFLVRPSASVVEVLQRCFQREPSDRWPSIGEAADALSAAYRQQTGRAYDRQRPAVAAESAAAPHDRRTTDGVTWADPRKWLTKALEAAGRDPAEADRLIQIRTGSRQAQAIDDLIAYEEALSIYTRLVASGRKDLEHDLANLCANKALVHESAGDVPGALEMYDRAIEIRERLVHQEGRRELAGDLANCYMNKAVSVAALGDNRAAVGLYDKTIEIYDPLVHVESRRELAHVLAMCYMNKAVAVWALGDNRAAVGLYDKAIEIRERLVHQEGRRELAGDLAWVQVFWANVVNKLGRQEEASRVVRDAVRTLESEIARTGRADLQNVLNWARQNLADLL